MQSIRERYIELKRKLFNRAYSFLNPEQRKAVFTTEGPVLILAGAGSGKTTVLVNRIVFIIRYGDAYYSEYVPADADGKTISDLESALTLSGNELLSFLDRFENAPCEPYRALAFTFTNKAAREIKERLKKVLDDDTAAKEIWAGTFHSICMKILRMYFDRLGYPKDFSIYDTDDSKKAILSAMKSCGLDDKQFPIKSVMGEISRAKDTLTTPEEFAATAGVDYRLSKIAKVYAEYQTALKKSGAMDFDDIIMNTVFLLRDNKDVRENFQRRFRYVSVDEFQDTNKAQLALCLLLSGKYNNIMAVGDDDQSIYKFRGATIENILGFDKTYPNATVIRLEQNYRSTKTILDAANGIISNNTSRHRKSLWTDGDVGSKIVLRTADDQNHEARLIIDTVETKIAREGLHYRDFAVLYRTNAQGSAIETAFARAGVPCRLMGGTKFFDHTEIKDILAYLYLVSNHRDRERFLRIINVPRRKIGQTTISAITSIADEQNISLFEVCENADRYVALQKSAAVLKGFADMINRLTASAYTDSLTDFYDNLLEETGYRRMLVDNGAEDRDRVDNIDEFKSTVIEYISNAESPTLTGLLEDISLVADVDKYDESADAVVLMTVHSAKGLEFPIVFIPGMEEDIFPSMQTIYGSDAEMEEERRLAYVAITRAKRELIILHAKMRMLYGKTNCNQVSRFVREIPTELIDDVDIKKQDQNRYDRGTRIYIGDGANVGQSSYPSYKRETPIQNNFTPYKKPNVSGFTPYDPKKNTARTPTADLSFKVGDRVKHITFGVGEIISAKPMGSDLLYEIVFEKAGTKKIMGTYAKFTRV